MDRGQQSFTHRQSHQQAHIPGVRQSHAITKQKKTKKEQRKKTKKSEAKTPKLFGEGMGDGGLCQNYLS